MKISQYTLHLMIKSGEWVFVSSESIDADFEVIYVDNTIRVQATSYRGQLTDTFQDFKKFVEMESNLDKWVDTINSEDCKVEF